MSYKQKVKYVDTKINGRLFPSFIFANFKKYKIPELTKKEEDPCSTKEKLRLKREK
jgi:hypothetical protein